MMRNLKTLGLVLVAAFALSAVAASAASAVVKHHFTGTGTLSTASGIQTFETTTGGGEGYKCEKVELIGSNSGTTTELTAEPKFINCTSFPGDNPVTVRPNGCHFTFTGETTKGNPTNEEKDEHANVHVVCPEEKEIEVRATEAELKCSAIPSQLVKHAVRYDEEVEQITITATAHGIRSTTEGVCGEGEHTDSSFTGSATVTTTGPGGLTLTTTTE